MNKEETIKKLKAKRLKNAILGLIGLAIAYFGFSESYEAHKEIMILDQGKLDQVRLK